jgi:DivIVA domain-containing protein
MALTPEDVVNKRFQPTKFREGYDQDEVDDFLDEVVLELRRLNQEGEELRQRLVASEARIAELQRGGGQSAGLTDQLQQQVPAAPAVAATTGGLPYPSQSLDASSLDPGNTNNLLQLARRLHEEHVREGIEKRDALIAEGHATAARVIAEAEAKQRSQISSLEQERALLEHSIDELRSFERDYRQKLKSYIESQLAELNGAAGASTGGVAVQAAESQPTSFQGFGGI